MDYLPALGLAATLLALASLSVRRPGGWTVLLILCGMSFSFRPGYFLPIALLFVLLLVSHPIFYFARIRKYYLLNATILAAIAFGLTAWLIAKDDKLFAELRRDFPFESIEDRLPPVRDNSPQGPLSDEALENLDSQEEELSSHREIYRSLLLRKLHEEKIELFVNSPGFGLGRMNGRPSGNELRLPDEVVAQPYADTSDIRGSYRNRDDLSTMHRLGVRNFVGAYRFGYFRDRQHVAGFQSHRLSAVPSPNQDWAVDSIELVGLLLHEKPVAYVSDELPRMDQLRKGPTRPLNDFESVGLAKLRKGEDLVVESMSTKIRMLGSIRSTKQCLECHGGQRGDLLGAFSYTLK